VAAELEGEAAKEELALGVTSEIYSWAKKYLVSHQLCKFSQLKR
jgi:hypothetical protein